MKFPIVKKGYEINLSCVYEGYHYDSVAVSADNVKQARYLLLKQAYDNGMTDEYDQGFTYISIKIRRCKQADTVLFDGKEMKRWDAEYELSKQKYNSELDAILNNESIQYCYIKKRGQYYREGFNGYAEYKLQAGVYETKEAVAHCRGCMELTLIPIDITEHNAYLNKHIEDIKTRLILPNFA